ncbi:MAG: choice-of-anchor Q domain-containing protein [Aggregatilineales bacterium]
MSRQTTVRAFQAIRFVIVAVLLSSLATSLFGTSGAHQAFAATLTVTALADTTGTCPSASNCTLRQAMTQAASGDVITFGISGTISLTSTLPAVANTLTIDGSGHTVIIDGGHTVGLFTMDKGDLTLNTLTLSNGNGVAGGGAVDNGAGPVNNAGTVNILNSTVVGNSAGLNNGGAIYNVGGTLFISNSTFFGNSGGNGGAINNNGTATIANSTFSGNSATVGGALDNVTHSTLNLGSAIIAGNSATGGGPDLGGVIVSLGNNLVGNTSGASGFVVSDQLNVNPLLNPLALNPPGRTQTMSLQASSPAIGTGNCNLPSPATPVSADQRGVTRKAVCDIGAYESAPIPDTIGIYRSSDHTFYLRNSNSTGNADVIAQFGTGSVLPIVGDWTGGGSDTIGLFTTTNGLFQLRNSNTPGTPDEQFVLGNPGDMPFAGHWTVAMTHDGGGVFRPSNGLIYLKNNLTTGFADYTMVLGIPGDVGLTGDWNGDGLDSPGVYRPSTQQFYLTDQVCNCSVFGSYQFQYGVSGDTPVIGDWIGQGHDGVGLFRQSNGFTYLRNSLTTGYADITFTYGIAGDVPVAGHWQLVYPPKANPGSILVPPTFAPAPTANGAAPGGLSD